MPAKASNTVQVSLQPAPPSAGQAAQTARRLLSLITVQARHKHSTLIETGPQHLKNLRLVLAADTIYLSSKGPGCRACWTEPVLTHLLVSHRAVPAERRYRAAADHRPPDSRQDHKCATRLVAHDEQFRCACRNQHCGLTGRILS